MIKNYISEIITLKFTNVMLNLFQHLSGEAYSIRRKLDRCRIKSSMTVFALIFIILVANQLCILADEDQKLDKSQESVYLGNAVVIRVKKSPPDSFNKQRKMAFNLLMPYLTKNISKASVVWQKDEFAYGKTASISNIYIQDYLDKKISTRKFIEYINLQAIEPVSCRKNNIEKAETTAVSDELIRKGSVLREKADSFRFVEKLDSAIRIYLQAIELNPNDSIALYWLAEIYSQKGNYELAREYYIKTLSIDPDFIAADDALYNLQKMENYVKREDIQIK